MWRTCPTAKAVPGVRVAYTDEREIQHAPPLAQVEEHFHLAVHEPDRLPVREAAAYRPILEQELGGA